jgi:hypothetical protein
MDGYGMIVGVDTGFHDSPFCRGRSARLFQESAENYGRVARSRDKHSLYGNHKRFPISRGNGQKVLFARNTNGIFCVRFK